MIPIEHIEHAIRELPNHNLFEGEIYRVAIRPPTRIVPWTGGQVCKEESKTLSFVKTGKSWALKEWSGY